MIKDGIGKYKERQAYLDIKRNVKSAEPPTIDSYNSKLHKMITNCHHSFSNVQEVCTIYRSNASLPFLQSNHDYRLLRKYRALPDETYFSPDLSKLDRLYTL